MRDKGGYGAVLAEGPVRHLLFASLAGRVAFSMFPLGFVLFAIDETGSNAIAGAMVAGFTVASALAPIRGRIVDRHGGTALAWFALACSGGIAGLVVAAALGAPPWVLVTLSALAGLVLPPLGPFTRAAWGLSLRDRDLQRAFALDSAGEEGALVMGPLLVAVAVAAASPRAALVMAAVGMLAGTVTAGRSRLGARIAPASRVRAPARLRMPAALWFVFGAAMAAAAALGAIDVAVPAAARDAGHAAAAGVLLALMAAGTVTGSLLAGGRVWRRPPELRVIALQLVAAAGFASAALAVAWLELLGLALLVPGAAIGVLFTTLYLVVDRLARAGTGTQTFAWLVTANNGGIGVGALVGGVLTEASGAAAGLWFAAVCALAGAIPAAVAAAMSARRPTPPQNREFSGVTSGIRRVKPPQGNDDSGEGL